MTAIETLKFNRENLSIEDFMSLTEKQKENIYSVKIIAPKFTNTNFDDFGGIQVKYKTPNYKAL
jgi:hypothetical protein